MLTADMERQSGCFMQYMATTLYYYRGILDTPEVLVGYRQAN
jgi:hypothetical protein